MVPAEPPASVRQACHKKGGVRTAVSLAGGGEEEEAREEGEGG